MDEKKISGPLGHPDNTGKGNAQTGTSGSEGGSGSKGDQRRKNSETHQGPIRREERPLDGTIRKEDIDRDPDPIGPGANNHDKMWDEPRLRMETRLKEPLITW